MSSADSKLTDEEQSMLYRFCSTEPRMFALVRRLAVHGLQPDPPYVDEARPSKKYADLAKQFIDKDNIVGVNTRIGIRLFAQWLDESSPAETTAESAALGSIVQAAIGFVDAIDTDEQIASVAVQAPDEWHALASAVIGGRHALRPIHTCDTRADCEPCDSAVKTSGEPT